MLFVTVYLLKIFTGTESCDLRFPQPMKQAVWDCSGLVLFGFILNAQAVQCVLVLVLVLVMLRNN